MKRTMLAAVILATAILGATPSALASRDPEMYVDGMSLYEYCRSAPPVSSDPWGLRGPNVRMPPCGEDCGGWGGGGEDDGIRLVWAMAFAMEADRMALGGLPASCSTRNMAPTSFNKGPVGGSPKAPLAQTRSAAASSETAPVAADTSAAARTTAGKAAAARTPAGTAADSLRPPPAGEPVTIRIDGSRAPVSSQHLVETGNANAGRSLTVDRAGSTVRGRDALRDKPPMKGFDRDEVPPKVFGEGGEGASVRYVHPSDNRSAGAQMGTQLRGVPDGTEVTIKVYNVPPGTKLDLFGNPSGK